MNTFPLKFEEDEHNLHLGLYQKWLCGDKTQKIEKMYSLSAFQLYDKDTGFVQSQGYQKYASYLYLTVTAIIKNSPEWYIRIYIDESVLNPKNPDMPIWKQTLDLIMELPRIQIICVLMPRYYSVTNNCHKELLAVMFRYLCLFDPNTSIILFRDIDNIYTDQHQYFVDKWLERGDDLCLYMNDNYKRQQICGLTPDGLILEDKFYTVLLSGLCSIKKPLGEVISTVIWQKMFAYIEDYTEFTFNEEYKGYKYYGTRFIYGFDELALTRVLLPIFTQMGLSTYTICTKIYDFEFFTNMFDNPAVDKFMKNLADVETIQKIKQIIIYDYWNISGETSGLAQYMLCILTNIYFGIIMQKSPHYMNEAFISAIKHKIIPNTLLMAIGNFTFKNNHIYNWYSIDGKESCGADVVKKFLATNERITLDEWMAGTVYNPCYDTDTDTASKSSLEDYNI